MINKEQRNLMEAYANACTAVRLCKTLVEDSFSEGTLKCANELLLLATELRDTRKVEAYANH